MKKTGSICDHEYCWGCLVDWSAIAESDSNEQFAHEEGCPESWENRDAESNHDDEYEYGYQYPHEPEVEQHDDRSSEEVDVHSPEERGADEYRPTAATAWNESPSSGWNDIPSSSWNEDEAHVEPGSDANVFGYGGAVRW